jgi:hypothetical protein
MRFPSALLMIGLAASVLPACSRREVMGLPRPNARPTVELTQAPVAGSSVGTYAYEVSWAGYDEDGRIARFQYAVDPPSVEGAETTWVATTANRQTFAFLADSVDSPTNTVPMGQRTHTIAVLAVDDAGARSAVATVSFTARTIAPTVGITSPRPSVLLPPVLPPSARIVWSGSDPDGTGSRTPVAYRWKLLTDSGEFPRLAALLDPDSLRRRYAPTFAGWDSLPGTTTSVILRDLVPGQYYTFVVVAIDEAGAYSPVFNLSTNMLNFSVGSRTGTGPILTLSGAAFSYTFPAAGVFLDPSTYVRADLPAEVPYWFAWSATTTSGGFIRGYRWSMDIVSIDDETERTDEATDLTHWSRWTTGNSTTLPAVNLPAAGGSEGHLFYVEAEDDVGGLSLGVIAYTIIRPPFDRDLLIVDDTWLAPDRAAGSCVAGPSSIWPTAAELDTLLYAVGGKPYRCYPSGTLSPPGLFAGYAFDTLGTHLSPPGTLSAARLSHYRNLIWITDLNSALNYGEDPYVQTRPMPLLRFWSLPGALEPLRLYLLMGGRMWLMGGGAAFASLRDYDAFRSANNVFSSQLGELVPGRFMYDAAHWRSEITVYYSARASRVIAGAGNWPGAPNYDELPPELDERSVLTDPLPPLRGSLSWPSSYAAEFLTRPNTATDIDELYQTIGGSAGSGHPVMTLYHGPDNQGFVFSGFPIWYFRRSQSIPLVDFVLQRVWGMTRQPVPR